MNSTEKNVTIGGRMYRLTVGLLMLWMHSSLVPMAAADGPADTSSGSLLDGYMRQALDHNPAVIAARSAVTAKEKDVRIALQLPDPQLSGGYFITPVETRVGPQRAKVGASQMIPWPGKLLAKRAEAREELDAARQRLRAAEADVFAGVRKAHAELYAVGREIAITRENDALLKQMEAILLAKYATATAQQVSVLKIQVEEAMLEDELANLEVRAAEARATLVRLLGITGDTVLPFPSGLDTLAVPVDSVRFSALADSLNPAVMEAGADVRAARVRVHRARQSFIPDFMIMTDYIITDATTSTMVAPSDNGKNPWIVGAAVTLPVWVGSKGAMVDKAIAAAEMQESMLGNRRNMTAENTVRLFKEYGDALRRIKLYETTLIPRARQTLDLMQVAYSTSSASVLDYLDAQRTLLRLEIALVMQQARREVMAGTIDALLGGELTRKELGGR